MKFPPFANILTDDIRAQTVSTMQLVLRVHVNLSTPKPNRQFKNWCDHRTTGLLKRAGCSPKRYPEDGAVDSAWRRGIVPLPNRMERETCYRLAGPRERYRSISLAIPVVPGLAVGDHEQRSAASDSNPVTNVRKKPAVAICHREKASLVAPPHQPP